MTSNDILGPQIPTAAVTSAAAPNATPSIAPLAPAVVPPPVIAAAQSASRFDFRFRYNIGGCYGSSTSRVSMTPEISKTHALFILNTPAALVA